MEGQPTSTASGEAFWAVTGYPGEILREKSEKGGDIVVMVRMKLKDED